MLCLEENKKVVLVGIPGVGKTTVVTKVVEILKQKNISVTVVSFGTMMFKEAQKNGITDRDEIRKLTMEQQQKFQKLAAERIAKLSDDIVIIDTHAFISTPSGFYPGMPNHVLQIIKPTNFIAVYAKPAIILNRRREDDARQRDIVSIDTIKKELAVQDAMLSSCSVISGSPLKPILNDEGKVDEAAMNVIRAIEV